MIDVTMCAENLARELRNGKWIGCERLRCDVFFFKIGNRFMGIEVKMHCRKNLLENYITGTESFYVLTVSENLNTFMLEIWGEGA